MLCNCDAAVVWLVAFRREADFHAASVELVLHSLVKDEGCLNVARPDREDARKLGQVVCRDGFP